LFITHPPGFWWCVNARYMATIAKSKTNSQIG
jgi:hypothetical protein